MGRVIGDEMSDMFYGAKTFSQDISRWDVSKETIISGLFHGTESLRHPLWDMNVSSFFERDYLCMPKEEHRQLFAAVFGWKRRREFMLVLVNHGYLYSASVPRK